MSDQEAQMPTYEQILGMAGQSIEGITPLAEVFASGLAGKVALVTGGSTGLGFNISYRLAEAGAKVVIASRSSDKGELAQQVLRGKGFDVTWVQTDVTKVADCYAAVEAAVETYGGVDILVANAAVWNFFAFLDMPEEQYDAVLDTDLKGEYFVAQAAARQMVKQGRGGKIVLVASVARHGKDQFNLAMMTHYNAAKGGVASLARGMARELKQYGINVNCVAPGGMITMGAMVNGMESHAAYGAALAAEQVAGSVNTPSTFQPDEVALVIYAMCTHMSDFMYGEVFDVDGGVKYDFQQKPWSYVMEGGYPGTEA